MCNILPVAHGNDYRLPFLSAKSLGEIFHNSNYLITAVDFPFHVILLLKLAARLIALPFVIKGLYKTITVFHMPAIFTHALWLEQWTEKRRQEISTGCKLADDCFVYGESLLTGPILAA